MNKQAKTALTDLGQCIKNVKGWNDPHIFIGNTRHSLSKEDARTMAERYAQRNFSTHLGITLQKILKKPEKRGQYRVRMLPGDPMHEFHYCKMEFHDGTNLLSFEMELDKASSGVSSREAFLAVEYALEHGYNQPEAWDFLTWEILSPDKVAQRIENTETSVAKTKHAAEVLATLKQDFPSWFQRTYRGKSIKWIHVGSGNQNGTLWKLICDIGEETPKVYTGFGISRNEAKEKALIDAANDLGYTISQA